MQQLAHSFKASVIRYTLYYEKQDSIISSHVKKHNQNLR